MELRGAGRGAVRGTQSAESADFKGGFLSAVKGGLFCPILCFNSCISLDGFP